MAFSDSEDERDQLLATNRSRPSNSPGVARRTILFLLTVLLSLFLFIWLLVYINTDHGGYTPLKAGITSIQFEHGTTQCRRIQSQSRTKSPIMLESGRKVNPRHHPHQVPILLRGGQIWDPEMGISDADVLLDGGLIVGIGKDLKIPNNTRVIEVKGRIVTPGVVDMHSHLGVDAQPELVGTANTNEYTSPLLPQMRSLDAFNTHDPAITRVRSGGVTTALVLPGSADVMGGEAYAFKLSRPRNGTAREMLFNYGLPREQQWRWMKMACGENPIRVFGSSGKMPVSRMGVAYLFRKKFAEAADLVQRQDAWCASSERIRSEMRLTNAFPESVELESLAALVRGQVLLNVHCYQTYDLEMVLNTAKEFGVKVAALHHALEAYAIPEVIKESGVTIATFADLWGYKKEAYSASVHAPSILTRHGVPVALKSDHPITNAQHLMFDAAKAYHYGLEANLALAAVTSVPARAMGLGDRIGRIQAEMDADLVIWDKNPLELGAYPLQVLIDGSTQIRASDDLSTNNVSTTEKKKVTKLEGCNQSSSTFTLRRIGHLYADRSTSWHSNEQHSGEIMVTVKDGVIQCLGIDCEPQKDGDVYYLEGATVIPGMVSSGVPLGLVDIELEEAASDGAMSNTNLLVNAIDGIEYGTKHMMAAYKAGVTVTIAMPKFGTGMISGISTAVRTSGLSGLDETAIVKEKVALHVQLGYNGRSKVTSSNSAQIAFLRGILKGNLGKDNIYGQVSRGQLVLAVHTNSRDLIASAVLLRQEIRYEQQRQGISGPGLRLVIIGGAEAYLLADALAEEEVAVILQPCLGQTWETRRCPLGPPLSKTGLEILHSAGVAVGVAAVDVGDVRGLIWHAGLAAARGLWPQAAVGMASWAVAGAFGVDAGALAEGRTADLVVYDTSPFDMDSRVLLVANGRRGVLCYPTQS